MRGLVVILGLWLILASAGNSRAGVVINELMYHPPEDSDRLQFVELFNTGPDTKDLSGWEFSKGIKYRFQNSIRLEPGAFLVLCKDREAFLDHYGDAVPVVGNFKGSLNHRGERLVLVDAENRVVDEVKYSDRDAWPRGPDGYSPSLERINPRLAPENGRHWRASELPTYQRAAGSPGRENDSYWEGSLPHVTNVRLTPAIPKAGEAVKFAADLELPDDSVKVYLHRETVGSAGSTETHRSEGSISDDRLEHSVPGQVGGCVVRLRISIEYGDGRILWFPSENEPRPAWSYYVADRPAMNEIGHGVLLNQDRWEPAADRFHVDRSRSGGGEPTRGEAAFIYFSDKNAEPVLFDFIRVTGRRGGFKLRFHSDQSLDGITVLNALYEGDPRYLLSEYLSFELFRLGGVPSPKAGHLRFTINGRERGHYLTVEQPNRAFLDRHQRDADGNLYKILWYGNGVIGQHEKKTNRHFGHDDVMQVLGGLRRLSGSEEWRFIQQHFNVDEVARYYAVSMCLSNWDGFFNNHFVFHDTKGTGRWEIYPWDQDKTWGDFDGGPRDYSWYELPLSYGMTGDRSPAFGRSFGRGPFGGVSWWRPPGHFSGPLLANPEFRKAFLARVKELCHGPFTEPRFGPVIDDLEKRLLPEVSHRARLNGREAAREEQRFRESIDSFRRQLKHRRTFLLRELSRVRQDR